MSHQTLTEARHFEAVVSILDRFERDSARLIPILQAIQDEYRYLPEEIMTYVATALDISPAKIYGVATFYGHFSLEPKGKYVVKVCDGTACHVKGSGKLIDALRAEFRLEGKAKTTTDMLFTPRHGFLPRGVRARAGHGHQRGRSRTRDVGRGRQDHQGNQG